MPTETAGDDSAELAAAGKAARADLPRSGHAELGAGSRDALAILQAQDESRVQELVPIRYGRMLASPFAFFRGAAAVMAADLAETPRTGFGVQLCGDAHLSNFGVFAAPDRRLVFDCNDFDETCPGPFEWDVKRLVASVAIAGRELGFGKRDRRQASLATVAAYRQACASTRRCGTSRSGTRGSTSSRRWMRCARRPTNAAFAASSGTSPRRRPRTAFAPWASSLTKRRGSCGSQAIPP